MTKRILLSILWIVALGWTSVAQNIPEPMQPRRLVNDFAGLFSAQQTSELEQALRIFNDSTSTQIAVVTVNSLDGYSIEEYSERLANKWGIGQKGKDNGALILVKPKVGFEKGEVRIEIGFGLEGAVPDVMASRIIRNQMIPYFKQNNYYGGVKSGAQALMALSKGEYKADPKESESDTMSYIVFITIFVIIIISIFSSSKKREGDDEDDNHHSGGSGIPFILFGGMMGSSRNSGSWGSFSGGSGGFGGFGGGGFGGGGASGSW